MATTAPDWAGYLGGVAAFAGTLFALVLAARQIRDPIAAERTAKAATAYLVDSVAVTTELGSAAALAVLYEIESSTLFTVAVCVVGACGTALAVASSTAYIRALIFGAFPGTLDKVEAIASAAGNALPLACYMIATLYAVRAIDLQPGTTWGYAAAVSWLAFSGTVQAILWYMRIWERPKTTTTAEQGLSEKPEEQGH